MYLFVCVSVLHVPVGMNLYRFKQRPKGNIGVLLYHIVPFILKTEPLTEAEAH